MTGKGVRKRELLSGQAEAQALTTWEREFERLQARLAPRVKWPESG